MTDELNGLRLRFGRLLGPFFWCHVPIFGVLAAMTGKLSVATAMASGAVVALVYQATWHRYGTSPVTRHVSAVLLVALPAILLVLMDQHKWQMDMHMYFFAVIALTIAWFDRTALLVAASATALHHLVLLYALPMLVFPNGGSLTRVGLHVGIVLFQTVVLLWVRDMVVGSVNRIQRMRAELVASSAVLEERNLEAEQAGRAKDMFLANMSHEIRTPINAIVGFCHLIRRDTLDARQRDQIAKINSAGVTLLRLVNDILDLSKNKAGQLTLEEVVFDPRAGLSRLVQMQSEPLHRGNLTFRTWVDPDVPALLAGDATRLNQVIGNLLGNAIKFTQEGTITIAVRVAARHGDRIDIETSIADNGIGMTAEQLSRMFTPFSQADSSTTRRFGGTGLGLAICRQIVERMDGWIRADSEPGKGSTFTILTRLRVPERQSLRKERPAGAVATLRVLVVDDNPIVLRIMQETFGQWGMTIDTAPSGHLAVTMAARAADQGTPYDLVILDWKMPGMDGLQTWRALQSSLGEALAPLCLVMTCHNIAEVRSDAEGDGIHGFLVKPVSTRSLIEALNRLPLPGRPRGTGGAQAGSESLRGRRVLLVEDNEINREIAAEVLARAGLRVDCAENGAIACRMIEADPDGFDAVLMDIQMPVMDGIAATRRIRETRAADRLPVIALTAHAFAEERQKSLDAGMNDHLSKPLDPHHLVATLQRWMPAATPAVPPALVPAGASAAIPAPAARPGQPTGAPAPAGSPAVAISPLLPSDLPPFDVPAALARVNGKKALLRRLILSFADSHADFCERLAGLLRDHDLKEAHRMAHSLRGVAASLELAQVASLSGQVEHALTLGATAEAAEHLDALRPLLNEAIAAARRLAPVDAPAPAERRAAAPVPAAEAAHPAHLAQTVDTIRRQIARRSLSARQGFVLLADLLQLDEAARLAHPLHLALQRLDYAAASAVLDRDYPAPDGGAPA